MIEDVKKYLCSREECLNDINISIKSCSRKDLVSRISHSDLVKMDRNIRAYFFECNYDEQGNVFLFDEISPKLIAEYITTNISLNVADELIYAYVCRTQMRIINSFYDEIKKGNYVWYGSLKNMNNFEKNRKIYEKLVKNRLQSPVKRLRGIYVINYLNVR